MWIRTEDGWYVHELRGACFVTWVTAADKANAAYFPEKDIDGWIELLSKMVGIPLEAVAPFA